MRPDSESGAPARVDSLISNARDLDDFLVRLGCDPSGRVGEADAWISEFVPISGDGTWMPETTDVAVAKLVTDRRTSTTD